MSVISKDSVGSTHEEPVWVEGCDCPRCVLIAEALPPSVYNLAAVFWHPTRASLDKPWSECWVAPKHGVGLMSVRERCGCSVCLAGVEPVVEAVLSRPTRVPMEECAEHVEALLASGWSSRAIERELRVDWQVIRRIRDGVRRTVDAELAERLLALPLRNFEGA